MNLDHQHQVDIVDHFDLKHEIEKDVERDDDPEEPHHEIDEIPPPPVKLQKENSYIVDRKSLEELREKLSQNLSDDKFFKAYTLAKEMVENDQDMHLMEEGVEYHMKMFPFLSREEVSNSLFDVFTFVVMEDWIRTKNLQ